MKTTMLPKLLPRTAALAAMLLAGGLIDSSAATNKSGVIAGQTWTAAMSPIRVVGDITVANLTIQPGVEVLFTGDFEFDCQGVINAKGNAAKKIRFHGDTGITWKGLNFANSADGSVLDHCIVENSNDHGIAITNSAPAISNCEIKNNSAGNWGGGLYIECSEVENSYPDVNNCVFENNSAPVGGGVSIRMDVSKTIMLRRCLISRNTATAGAGGGVSAWTDSANPVSFRLVDCSIIDNIVQGSFPARGYLRRSPERSQVRADFSYGA